MILSPLQAADREPAPGDSAVSGAPGVVAFGPVVWSSGRDLEERAEQVRREGRPIPPAELTGYVWPLPGAVLTNPYGPSRAGTFRVDGQRFHDGLDLSTTCGDPIVAAHGGTVLAAGRRYDDAIGWLGDLTAYFERLDGESLWKEIAIAVVIDDGNGYRSVYAHFKSVVVTVGQRVEAGDVLGFEGKTGNATGCHLHYAIFSPRETASIRLVRRIAERSLLPGRAIARIDPLLVLPPLAEGSVTLAD